MGKWYSGTGVATQTGVQDTPSSTYARGNADITFVVGQRLMARFPTNIPRGAVINSSSMLLNIYSNKDAAGSMSHNIYTEKVGDSDRLVEGRSEWGRALSNAFVTWDNTWTSGVSDVETRTSPSLVSIVQEAVNRPDWKPGGYITIIMLCTAESGDMRARLNNDFIQRPEIFIDWSLPVGDTRRTQINLHENPNHDPALDNSVYDPLNTTTSLGHWYQNPHYGAYVDGANYGTLVRDNTVQRVAGRNCMKFTYNTPPAANDKATGPYSQYSLDGTKSYVFCGWIYIPSIVTETVGMEFVYWGGQSAVQVTARDQWVPFCTRPFYSGETGKVNRFAAVYTSPPFTAGRYWYLSEPMVIESDFQLMPWSGLQSDNDVVDYGAGNNGQHGYREWVPRTWVPDGGGVPRPRSKWTMNASGLLVLSEGRKSGPAVQSLPAAAVTTLSGNVGDM